MWSLNIANNSANIPCLSQFLLSGHSAYFLVSILIFYFTSAFNIYFSSWFYNWSLSYIGFKFIQAWASVCSLNVKTWVFSLPSSGKEELFPLWFLYQMTEWSEKTLNASLVSLPICHVCMADPALLCAQSGSTHPPKGQVWGHSTAPSNQAFPRLNSPQKGDDAGSKGTRDRSALGSFLPSMWVPPCLFLIMEEQIPVLLLPWNSVISWCSGS